MGTRTWQVLWLGDLTEYSDIFEKDLFKRYRDVVATHLSIEDDDGDRFADRVEAVVSNEAFDLVLVEASQASPEVLRTLRRAGPALPVLMIAEPDEGERIVEGYELGIDGYVTRTDDADVFRQLLSKQVFELLSHDLDPPTTRRPTANEILRYAHYYNVLHPFFIVDVRQRLRYVNQAGREFVREAVGGDAELVVGSSLESLPIGAIDSELESVVQRALGGEEVISEHRFEELTGNTSLREVFYRPVIGAGGDVVAVSISVYIPMHPELREARRHAALGRLAASIAHDFNNLLSIVSTSTAICRREVDREGGSRPYRHLEQFESIDRAVEKGKRLTSSLLRYTGRKEMDRQRLSLVDFLESNREFVQQLIGEDIDVTFELDPATPEVEVDPKAFEQVLMNLVANARDAMPTGGKLQISTRPAEYAPEQKPPIDEMRPGSYALLTVSDTGEGMSGEAADSAFEPYFSTRGGENTGLGLATVQGIIRESRGYIELETESGSGMTVTIYLPAVETDEEDEEETSGSPNTEEDPDLPQVLIAEDEEGLRLSLRRLLSGLSCEIHAVGSADEALELVPTLDHLELLLTDVVMPGASGFDLAERLEEHHPQLEIVFLSGYSDEVTEKYGRTEGKRWRFIQKPFDPKALVTLVEELLAQLGEDDTDAPGDP